MKSLLAKVLPPDAARRLQRAAETQNTAQDPRARDKAIDQALRRIKREYPQHFRQE